jgi:hypothetical protein
MIENVLNQIISSAPAELVFVLMGSLILYIIQRIKKAILYRVKKYKIRRYLSKKKRESGSVRVVDLANGDPDFSSHNLLVRISRKFGRKKSFYISPPDKYQESIKKKEKAEGYSDEQLTKFENDISFSGRSNFHDLEILTGISNLGNLIEKHRKIIGEKFINNEDGLLFNGKKFGIFDIRFTRFGRNEEPGASIYLFETDYFTHRVMRSIYNELKSENHEITKVTAENFLRYRPFLTSFGINTLLITEGDTGREIVLTKRSKKVHTEKSLFHITMNEGLSMTDIDPFGNVDLELCFKRGLKEELGINDQLYELARYAAFYDFFLEFSNFEIGLSSVIELDVNFEKDIEPLIARDKTLESSYFKVLPLKKGEIDAFLMNNQMIPHGKYVLERVLLRENIFIE